MFLGIKLSNLTRDKKNLKVKKNIFTQFCRVPKLQHSAKENLPSARLEALGKITLLPSVK